MAALDDYSHLDDEFNEPDLSSSYLPTLDKDPDLSSSYLSTSDKDPDLDYEFDRDLSASYLPTSDKDPDFTSSYLPTSDEDPRISELKLQINPILKELGFTTIRYSEYWTVEDYTELYEFILQYKHVKTSKWLPFQKTIAQKKVKFKITGISLHRRDALFNHYGIKDEKDEHNFLNLKQRNPSAFVNLMPLMKLDKKLWDLKLGDLQTRVKGLMPGGRTNKRKKRRTKRAKKRKSTRQFRR